LPLQVGCFHDIPINNAKAPYAGAGEKIGDSTAQCAASND
jgi:hypothetical protein